MINYLNSIDNELKEYYLNFANKKISDDTIKDFCENTVAIIDYYIEPIFISGKNIVSKILNSNKSNLTEDEVIFINNYKINEINEFKNSLINGIKNCYENRKDNNDFYEQIIEIIVNKLLKLFKYAQLSEYKNNGIIEVNLMSDNNSCAICKTKSNFKYNVENLMENYDNFHSFCKLTIEPINNCNIINFKIGNLEFNNVPYNLKSIIDNTISKLKIYIPNMISDKKFYFVNNIFESNEFQELLKSKYTLEEINDLKNKVNNDIFVFSLENNIYISNDSAKDLNYTIVKFLIIDMLLKNDINWWQQEYYNKIESKQLGKEVAIYSNLFVNYIAEQDYESYFIESAIHYIINPELLKTIDEKCYNELNNNIFKTEFLRG